MPERYDIKKHGKDWCHVCGQTFPFLADIFYTLSPENTGRFLDYIRICPNCLKKAIDICKQNPVDLEK